MKKIIFILIVVIVIDLLYSNSDYYISSYLWKHVNAEGVLCGDNIIFGDSLYARDCTKIRYYSKGYNGEVVGHYLICFDFGIGSRLLIYSELDGGIGVYRNVMPAK